MGYMLWVTTSCNLNCKYCYEGHSKKTISMTKSIADQAIDFINKHCNDNHINKTTIGVHGGEPLIQFDTIKYLEQNIKSRLSKNCIKAFFSMTTNGVLLDDFSIDYLVANFDEVSVSIDGTKESHDLNRTFIDGKGSYTIVIENALKLLYKKPDLRIRLTFTPHTVEQLYENVQHLLNLGFKIIVPAPNYEDKWESHHLKKLYDQLILLKGLFNQIKDKDIYIALINKKELKPKGKCDGGLSSFHIYPDGKLYPCVYTAGNNEFGIGDIFNGVNYGAVRNLCNIYSTTNTDCIGCTYYDYCISSRCKIINKALTGDFVVPSPIICGIENVKYKVLKQL